MNADNISTSYSQLLAVVSIAGFAIQRCLELLDPLFSLLVIKITDAKKAKNPDDPLWGWTDKELKIWLMALVAFLISLPIAALIPQGLPEVGDMEWGPWDNIIIALAMSAGANGMNSLLKFGEFVKESRKVEVQPLPVVSITPTVATVGAGKQSTFLARVIGNSNKTVMWKVLEHDGGDVDMQGNYTAPANSGTYHVAAISVANEAAFASATVIVR